MNTTTLIALAKVLEKDAKKTRLDPGTYPVDETITLHVAGLVTKGADVAYTPTADIPLLPTLAIVLEKAGFQRENAKTILIAAMQEALELAHRGEGHLTDRLKDAELAMEHVREITAALPKKTKQGATRVDVKVQVVGMANAA